MFAGLSEIRVNEQITELITTFPQAKVVAGTPKKISLPVKSAVPGGVTVLIVLPREYPKAVPTVSVAPANLAHPWLQPAAQGKPAGTLWHESMLRHYYEHDEKALVKLVGSLLETFKGVQQNQQGQGGPGPRGAAGAGSGAGRAAGNVQAGVQGLDINYDDVKRDVLKLSDDELIKLLTDKEAYAQYLANMKELSNMGSSIKELVQQNQVLAESSLEKRDQIADVKNQIAIIRSTEVQEVKNKYEALAKEHNTILSSINVNNLKEKLAEAAGEADDASEALSQKLLDKGISVEAFVDEYCKSREVYHKRTMVLQSLDH